ncbi:hypothetical protein ACFQAS_06890 [Halopenitus salinus]|uniref:DUF8173 domain-containing protein n=1 Tax=Halopenitus salinus TaxID=1198295 RepID=A0ABD5V165_9EURY
MNPPLAATLAFEPSLSTVLVPELAQVTQPGAPQPGANVSLIGSVLGSVLLTVVIGGGLLAFAPDYVDRTTGRILDDPGETVLYGLGIGIVLVIGMVVLFITVFGIVLAIPLILATIVASELGYLAAGRAVTDEWGPALLVAMGVSAIVGAVPILGAVVGLVLSSFGIGAAYLDLTR